MSLAFIHGRLADTSSLFIAAIGIWALYSRIRSQPLSSGWFGAAVIAEILLIVQVALGVILFLGASSGVLPRPFIHILYGITAVITLPAAYTYISRNDDENALSMAMVFVCIFLWFLIDRTAWNAVNLPPGFP